MIIIVAGLPGSGKSYFAERLASKIGALYIGSDKVRKSMDAMGQYSFEDKLQVYKEMVKILKENLNKYTNVVVDATFYLSAMRDLFLQLAANRSVPICYILIEASEQLTKERVSQPRKDSEADFAVYKKVKAQYEELTIPHLKLKSTNENIDKMLETAMTYIHTQDAGERN